ncbi:MAG: glucuronate isomerase [Bacteroidetes bacterium]|nr:glucuronate isomerase [Bacteroidota bacterium]
MKKENTKTNLDDQRFFDPNPFVRDIAYSLYQEVRYLPLYCPHGHIDPVLLSENAPFKNPAALFITPDHYVFRLLYSQGISLERLGIPFASGSRSEYDDKKIWELFAEYFYLFAGTPTGIWFQYELAELFGIKKKLNGDTADEIWDEIENKLRLSAFLPRTLFEKFNIAVLSTTDAATDSLEHHKNMKESKWKGKVIPTFRPDGVVKLVGKNWKENIQLLGERCGGEITSYQSFIRAMENRREYFKSLGAVATDHDIFVPYTERLSDSHADLLLQKALTGMITPSESATFESHMMMEFARMSIDDGLTMQIHPGSFRNHNVPLFDTFGPDKGADIPVLTEFTMNLRNLLNAYGNDSRLTLVLFTLDETAYSRELAPLAGHYPAMRLGPPWWFHDSIEGMLRYRRMVTETASIYNTAGFNDDTRAFLSIPARHDLSRRIDATYLADLVAKKIIDREDASHMILELTNGLVKKTYKL